MIEVNIQIWCKDRSEAEEKLREIGHEIYLGQHSESCSRETQDRLGGEVFVTPLHND